MKGYLLLEDGTVLGGKAFGAKKTVMGEMFFHTEMAGYEESLLDPANGFQIMVMTYPILGNVGFAKRDLANKNILPKAIIVKNFSQIPNHWECEQNLPTFLIENDIFGLSYVDTRLLTRKILATGPLKCCVTTTEPTASLLEELKNYVPLQDMVSQSSCKEPNAYHVNENSTIKVSVIDLGASQSLLAALKKWDINIFVHPYKTNPLDIFSQKPDAIFVSHGGGNPYEITQTIQTIQTITQLQNDLPIYGVGLGALTLALANYIPIQPMANGNRGSNYPVISIETGKTFTTTQNIGFCISSQSFCSNQDQAAVTYKNINDETVAGFAIKNAKGILFDANQAGVLQEWIESLKNC